MLDKDSLKPIIESIIFAAESAISFEKIFGVLEGEEKAAVKAALGELIEDYRNKAGGFYIEEVASGYQFRTNPEFAPWLRRFFKIGMQKISKAAMETLAVTAYKQPVTRGEIEGIRGVDSGGVLATLMEKRFIKIVGRKEVPGRPVVYGTTKEFLETFELRDLSCLPSLKDLKKMEEEYAQEQGQQRAEDTVKDSVQGAQEAADGQEQNETGDQDRVPGQNETGDQDRLPEQNQAGDQDRLPGQNETGEQDRLPGQNETGDQDRLPEQNQTGDQDRLQNQDETGESIQDGTAEEGGEALQLSAEDSFESGWEETDEETGAEGSGSPSPGPSSEDNSDSGDNLEEEGGGAHPGRPRNGQREDDN
ncbi:MAG: SMC-Scp complex subunit ScpB [Deltaproteobacteria bacterium GWA2_55_10]|nr:MAG: SMC-Scp complex subunit ScpB [Deltaproteobacteria bacterium GWA2_55_10]